MKTSIQELVRADLVARERLGQERYGTSLYAYNGRSAILDAYQEALDLACYLRQLIEEMTVGDGTISDPGTIVQPDPEQVSCPFDCGTCHSHEDDQDGVQIGDGNSQTNTFGLPPHQAPARQHDSSECGIWCTHGHPEPGS